MLQTLREKTSGWIATVVMGLLIVPFAFVGVNEYLGGGLDNSVARVKAPPSWWSSAPSWMPVSLLWQHEDITAQDFQMAFFNERQRQQSVQGEAFDAREFDTVLNKRAVLDGLIDRKIVELAAKRAGISVGDDALRGAISTDPTFQVGGKFDSATYVAMLSQQGLTPVTYQQQLRDNMIIALVPQGLQQSSFATDQQLGQIFSLLGETRDVTLASLPMPLPDSAPVSDEQLKQWYDAHRSDFRKPEQVSVEYVEIDASKLPPLPSIDQAELRKRYDAEKTRFSSQQRLASHILITVAPGADAATQQAAEQKAAELTKQAQAPSADFAALAKANSQDEGSASSGGDLGWVSRNMMVEPFENALFAIAKPGQVVGPIKTEFGYHIIKLREVKGEAEKSFAQVRAQLLAEAQQEAAAKQYNDVAGKLVSATLENPDSLAAAAQATGLPLQKAALFSRSDAPGLLSNPLVLRNVFSEQQILDRTPSQLIQLNDKHAVVVRVTDHSVAADQSLDTVKERVIAAVRADRAEKVASQQADAVLERIGKGESLTAIAKASKYETNNIPSLPRGLPLPSMRGNEAIFASAKPAEGKVSAGKVQLDNGQFVVFTVDKVTPGNFTAMPEVQRAQFRQQIAQLYGGVDVMDYVNAARKQFKIVVHEDRL